MTAVTTAMAPRFMTVLAVASVAMGVVSMTALQQMWARTKQSLTACKPRYEPIRIY
jgi:hypothetical protein